MGLSFKNRPEDIELYKWIKSHSNQSGFIKDTLRNAKDNNTIPVENKESDKKDIDLIDLSNF